MEENNVINITTHVDETEHMRWHEEMERWEKQQNIIYNIYRITFIIILLVIIYNMVILVKRIKNKMKIKDNLYYIAMPIINFIEIWFLNITNQNFSWVDEFVSATTPEIYKLIFSIVSLIITVILNILYLRMKNKKEEAKNV